MIYQQLIHMQFGGNVFMAKKVMQKFFQDPWGAQTPGPSPRGVYS